MRLRNLVSQQSPLSFLVSFLAHLCALVVAGLMVQAGRPVSTALGLTASMDAPETLEELAGERPEAGLTFAKGTVPFSLRENWDSPQVRENRDSPQLVFRPILSGADLSADAPAADVPQFPPPRIVPPGTEMPPSADRGPLPSAAPPTQPPSQPADLAAAIDTPVADQLAGRTPEARAALVQEGGGSAGSERVVERGLRWLVAHQRDDGGWSFDLKKTLCQGQCRNPGTQTSTTAATALGLLPFLGAGYTHRGGEYRDVVRRGLYYLSTRALVGPHGADLQEGTMYGQGLATIALCEAYGMTKDPALKDLAQRAIRFVVYAQDPKGGGWRYRPGQPGDTTVTGWQLMALKSGQMARLDVPSPTVFLAARFLDSVESEEGALYGYMTPQPRDTTTTIGLLCRMYTGWRRERPALRRGVEHLCAWGPSADNMYYNYYATQVLHHFGGPQWDRWNQKLRDRLIAAQAAAGHESGSWHFSGGQGDQGGRLYNTAMAILTLEVYYRYLPLYRDGD